MTLGAFIFPLYNVSIRFGAEFTISGLIRTFAIVPDTYMKTSLVIKHRKSPMTCLRWLITPRSWPQLIVCYHDLDWLCISFKHKPITQFVPVSSCKYLPCIIIVCGCLYLTHNWVPSARTAYWFGGTPHLNASPRFIVLMGWLRTLAHQLSTSGQS